MTVKPIEAVSIGDIAELSRSWLRDLAAANLSPRTIQSYGEAVRLFRAYLVAQGMPTVASSITREHVAAFVSDQLARYSPKTASVRYGSLKVFFKWCVEDGEIRESPMLHMRKPKLPERLADIPKPEDLRRLMQDCSGKSFADLRDTAILRVFLSTGARLAEVSGLRYDPAHPESNDVDLDAGLLRFYGKGDRERIAPLDAKAVKAIDRYIRRARRQHDAAATSWLWLGKRGRFGLSGISQMVRQRAEACGFKLHPHQFRHYRADKFKAAGLADGHIMAIMGWRDPSMLRRYGAANTSQRAIEAVKRMEPDDV